MSTPAAPALGTLLAGALGAGRIDLQSVALHTQVRGVAQALDRVRPGFLFVARVGRRVDAHGLVDQAIAAGAVCVVGHRVGLRQWPGSEVPYVHVPDDRWATSALAAEFHGQPSRSLTTIGVTGTDGKTTTSALLHHLLQGDAAQPIAGLISTAGARIGQERLTLPGHFTTPEATEVHELLARMRDAGARFTVLESSSHGFALRRLEHVHYALAVWTTLSPEHLDDHGSFEAYREAKRTLVRRAPVSILNRDDASFTAFAEAAGRVIAYGVHPGADVRAERVHELEGGIAFDLAYQGGPPLPAHLPMPGLFNLGNALAALAAAVEAGLDPAEAVRRCASFPGVPGRMQLVQHEPFRVIVDFAHTPPALERALGAVAPAPGGRRIVVIGAAGERDPGKRGPLGRIAVTAADLAVFTEEDHRGEDPHDILAAMAAGAAAAGAREGERYLLVPDRRAAIAAALTAAGPGDAVLLCGKGHERTLERFGVAAAWDEVAEARAALAALGSAAA